MSTDLESLASLPPLSQDSITAYLRDVGDDAWHLSVQDPVFTQASLSAQQGEPLDALFRSSSLPAPPLEGLDALTEALPRVSAADDALTGGVSESDARRPQRMLSTGLLDAAATLKRLKQIHRGPDGRIVGPPTAAAVLAALGRFGATALVFPGGHMMRQAIKSVVAIFQPAFMQTRCDRDIRMCCGPAAPAVFFVLYRAAVDEVTAPLLVALETLCQRADVDADPAASCGKSSNHAWALLSLLLTFNPDALDAASVRRAFCDIENTRQGLYRALFRLDADAGIRFGSRVRVDICGTVRHPIGLHRVQRLLGESDTCLLGVLHVDMQHACVPYLAMAWGGRMAVILFATCSDIATRLPDVPSCTWVLQCLPRVSMADACVILSLTMINELRMFVQQAMSEPDLLVSITQIPLRSVEQFWQDTCRQCVSRRASRALQDLAALHAFHACPGNCSMCSGSTLVVKHA